ncbi:chemotaxis protein [Aminipila butyrica]|uniref:Chemotaxis protein n=1 Tax=Aminipila butyrica TaxID=433296 RepID=A0A858BTJ9_9FIRM|nr:PocR ligand-binding domain-containing protein [Aminipila butyrica]QIB68519.1 chemotaxis protein [Aminipila butyrica]
MIKLEKFLDLKKFQQIQDLFSDATGLAAIAVDAQGNYISQGSNFTDFCIKYTRGSEEGLRRCVKCDNECTGAYYCHAGLMDFSTDLIIHGEKVGAIIGGQVLPAPPDEEKFRKIAQELDIPEETYLAALRKVPIRDEKTIRAGAQMLGEFMNQLVNLSYFEAMNKEKMRVFDEQMHYVVESIDSINNKIKELQKVAAMEKILALNASVEAARAGQAGVGFAVVAQEIESISTNAARIYSEIQDYSTIVRKAIQAMSKIEL